MFSLSLLVPYKLLAQNNTNLSYTSGGQRSKLSLKTLAELEFCGCFLEFFEAIGENDSLPPTPSRGRLHFSAHSLSSLPRPSFPPSSASDVTASFLTWTLRPLPTLSCSLGLHQAYQILQNPLSPSHHHTCKEPFATSGGTFTASGTWISLGTLVLSISPTPHHFGLPNQAECMTNQSVQLPP